MHMRIYDEDVQKGNRKRVTCSEVDVVSCI